MKILITSTSGDTHQLLEPLGYLAEPAEEDNYFYLEVESLEELFHLSEILGKLLIKYNQFGDPIIEILNDYIED